MGFLKVNRKRQRFCKGIKKRRVGHEREVDLQSFKLSVPHFNRPNCPPVERLPRELLEMILVYSANFNLAQASPVLASKLSKTASLEAAVIREKLYQYEGKLPTSAVLLPFVTKELLESVNVKRFCSENSALPPFVPLQLEYKLQNPMVLALVAFMTECGCMVEGSQKVYMALALAHQWKAIASMADLEHKTSPEIVLMALNSGQSSDMVIKLLKLSIRAGKNRESHYSSIWQILDIAKRAQMHDVVTAANELIHE